MDYKGMSIKQWKAAIRQAAEDMYESDMVETNMAMLEITEVAEAYEHYENDEEKQKAIQNTSFATKEEWIQDRIQEWIDATIHEVSSE